METAGTCASAHSVSMAGKNQRVNLQRTMQRSDAEKTPGRAAEHADGEIWNSSRPDKSAANGCTAWSTTLVRPSGGAWGLGDEESSSRQEQPKVAPEHRWAAGLDEFSQQQGLAECLPSRQLLAVRQASLGPNSSLSSGSLTRRPAAAQSHAQNGRA